MSTLKRNQIRRKILKCNTLTTMDSHLQIQDQNKDKDKDKMTTNTLIQEIDSKILKCTRNENRMFIMNNQIRI